jgi:ABC-type glutathione transport system ATPase component
MSTEPLLAVRHLSKSYGAKAALSDINLTLQAGGTLGLIGASGCGKTTLARCIARFEEPDHGEILWWGKPACPGSLAPRQVQLIFQQPASTLNPRFTAREIVEEPLLIQRMGTAADRLRIVTDTLHLVGIPASALPKRAHSFSGGERQRLAIARALVLEPKLLILDESFAGLDPALASQIAALLIGLQARLHLTYILIAHDLGITGTLATEVAVMEAGRIVEHGPAADVLAQPQHPRTQELLRADAILRQSA